MSISSQQTHRQCQAIVSEVGPQVDCTPAAVHLPTSRPSHRLSRRRNATIQQAAEPSWYRVEGSRAIMLNHNKQQIRQATVRYAAFASGYSVISSRSVMLHLNKWRSIHATV